MDEEDVKYRNALLAQIKDAYGRVESTYTTHWKQRDIYFGRSKKINCCEIILSSISTTGLVGFLISEKWWVALVGTIFSAISLSLTLYTKDANYEDLVRAHRKAADDLWPLREKYISLMTDFNLLSTSAIIEKRDEFEEELSKIYKATPTTSSEAFKLTRKALKIGDNPFFSQSELESIMPLHLRKTEL